LLEMVYQHLELIEKDYFGLQFTDNGAPLSAANCDAVVSSCVINEYALKAWSDEYRRISVIHHWIIHSVD
jgi:hypothetical protein